MAKDVEKLLESIGLLPSESKVYIKSLQLGPETVQNIAKTSGISRTAAYDAIEMLQNRGLMTTTLAGKKRLYTAEDPDRLVSYLKEEEKRLHEKVDQVTSSLDLLRMMVGGVKPVVRVFEGKEALFAYFDYISKTKSKTFDEIANSNDIYEYLDERELMAARRAYKWTIKKARLLHQGEVRNPRKGVEYRKLSGKWGDFHGNVTVIDNALVLVSYTGTLTTVIIESEVFANSFRTLYEVLWHSSKPVTFAPKKG